MQNNDLMLLKKYYGEDMMHYCRSAFPTLLENNILFKTINNVFAVSKHLYEDLKKYNSLEEFDFFIQSISHNKIEKIKKTDKTPMELLDSVGYNLYECKTKSDIQKFEKYYTENEKLCTFDDERLITDYVFFATKKNVDEIKREDFNRPERQDLYGTSVLSIQFKKNENHSLSIKNRYNHTVDDPDSTFNNNLENIVPGLTYAFFKKYNLRQQNVNKNFYLPNYVCASDGKYYKYNYEINNIYFCPNNIIIKNFEPKFYEKEKYIIMDYFILDLQNKKIINILNYEDGFSKTKRSISKIQVNITFFGKNVIIFNQDGSYEIISLDDENNIIGYENDFILKIDDNFMFFSKKISNIKLDNAKEIGNNFLASNKELKKIFFPKVEKIGNDFIPINNNINNVSLPNCKYIGDTFLNQNTMIEKISFPNVVYIGRYFLYYNREVSELILPKVEIINSYFLQYNINLTRICLPKLKFFGSNFLRNNAILKEIMMPELICIGEEDFGYYCNLNLLYIPNCKYVGKVEFIRTRDNCWKIEINSCDSKLRLLRNNLELKEKLLSNLDFTQDKRLVLEMK